MRIFRRTHADVAVAVAYCDARIRGNGFGRYVQVKLKTVSPLPNVAGQVFPAVINRHHYAKKTEQPKHKENFGTANLRGARIAGAARRRTFIQFDPAPENQNQRPPMANHHTDTNAAVVVKEQQQPNEK